MTEKTDRLSPEWAAHIAAALDPVHPDPERAALLRARVLKRVSAGMAPDPHLTVRARERRWHNISPGVDIKLLRRSTDTETYILRLAAGMRLPPHDHPLDEECLVLEGDVWLGNTHAFAGDYHMGRRGIPHGEIHTDAGCLLFLRGAKPFIAEYA